MTVIQSPVLPRLLYHLRGAATRFLDLILPPSCVGCGSEMGNAHGLCTDCWQSIRFLSPPACARCGLPFAYDAGPDALCPACVAVTSHVDRLRAVFAYDDKSRGLILSFKHGDRLQGLPAFAGWLARAGDGLIGPTAVIAPVPLHWSRLFRRRYNQSALLSHALARHLRKTRDLDVKVVPRLLIRGRATRPQGHLGRMSRQENVRGAFRLGSASNIEGAHILLIDDVLTTGATVEECARILKRGGAATVDVLTLARALRTD